VVPVLDGVALPGMSVLRMLANVTPAQAAAALLFVPGNIGQSAPTVDLVDGLRYEPPPPGEVWGRQLELQADGSWLALPGRFHGQPTADGKGFSVLSEDEVRELRAPISTPAVPPPPYTTLPLPAWLDRPEVLPPSGRGAPAGPSTTVTPGAPVQDWRDLVVDNANADNNRQQAIDRAHADPALQDPAQLEGRTGPGGIGTWGYPTTPRDTTQASGQTGAQYQEQITDKPFGLEINIGGSAYATPAGTPTAEGGAWFDDVRVDASGRTTLVDGKAWGGFVLPQAQFWINDVLGQADRQVRAISAGGLQDSVKIEWQVSTPEAASEISKLLQRNNYGQIDVVVVPKKG
jgi:hypothetical protein